MKDSVKLQIAAPHFLSFRGGNYKSKAIAIASFVPADRLALIFCGALAAALVLFFLWIIKPLVTLPADILMWEETDFVGNIIKLNTGAPLYTTPSDGNSMIYNPASFLLTYAIAWAFGLTKSIAALRLIQLGYTTCAALVAAICARKLFRLAFPECEIRYAKTWAVFTFLAMFLAATAPESNKFVFSLHVDALALLVSIAGFWAMLRYAANESLKNLLVMSVFPALGFLTKQFLISWAAVMFLFLLLHHPKNFRRLALFALVSTGLIAVAYAACYLLWGDNYIFWAFDLMGGERKKIVFSPDSFSISLARGFDHLARVWLEVFVGIIGGWQLVRENSFRRVAPFIAAWLALIAGETVSSGAGWDVLYHFGPGVLIGAVLMFAALPKLWQEQIERRTGSFSLVRQAAGAFVMTATVIGIFGAWHVLPTGGKTEARYVRAFQPAPDVNRYIAEIEREFNGMPVDKVLLGAGSWIYLRHDVLQKDRAISLNDQPMSGIYENFAATNKRIRRKTYQKILVQDFDSPLFLYDWSFWKKPSGFKQALLENYARTKIIEPPQGSPWIASQIRLAGPVSVFVPR